MRTLIFILFPLCLSAQFRKDLQPMQPVLNLPDPQEIKTGKILEFISYPLFTGSGFCAGLSKKFGEIDSPSSNRSEFNAIAASAGFVTSVSTWGVGMSLQDKPEWKDLYKLAGVIGFSGVGYYLGYQTAEIFKSK